MISIKFQDYMMNNYIRRWKDTDTNQRCLIGVLFLGINAGVVSTTFKNLCASPVLSQLF